MVCGVALSLAATCIVAFREISAEAKPKQVISRKAEPILCETQLTIGFCFPLCQRKTLISRLGWKRVHTQPTLTSACLVDSLFACVITSALVPAILRFQFLAFPWVSEV